MLESHEVAEKGRGGVIENIARIVMVGDVENRQGAAQQMVPDPRERQVELLPEFHIEREEAGETSIIRRADVVLLHIDERVGKAGMKVDDGRGRDSPDVGLEPAPADQAVGNVGGQVGKEVWTEDGLLEGHKNLSQVVEIPARPAVHVGKGPFRALRTADVQGGLKLLIAGTAAVG